MFVSISTGACTPKGSFHVLLMSTREMAADAFSPCMRARPAGFTNVAAAVSCAAMRDPDIARSAGLTLGTEYPAASATAGRKRRTATERRFFRMMVVLAGYGRVALVGVVRL